MKSLKIWSNARIPPAALDVLRSEVVDHELTISSVAEPIALADCEIAFGQPDLDQLALPTSRVKWIQLTSAGYTRYDNPLARQILQSRRIVLTTASGVYADPCAQHVLAFMLAHARQLPPAMDL